MSKSRNVFTCSVCGATMPKWVGQCPECAAWDTMQEVREGVGGASGGVAMPPQPVLDLSQVKVDTSDRFSSGFGELDRVLGGGLVAGSVVLVGGDPGIGKSTLLLQCLAAQAETRRVLYVAGEESAQQVALRAQRLRLSAGACRILVETQIERILEATAAEHPQVLVADSIQTLSSASIQSAPGTVSQVRETAAQLVRYAKRNGCCVVLVGHVTKEGYLAGPRVLEHMVDTVLYFEGDDTSRFRLLRATKNRFGAVNEVAVFAMTGAGLREVTNPSAMFVRQGRDPAPGSVVFATQQGSRPLLVEVQALVDSSVLSNPRRLTVGMEHSRLGLLLAVMHRHAGYPLHDQDVFINIVGGIRITEPAVDLPVVLAVASSFQNRALPGECVAFGEVGLSGEVRPVQSGAERLREIAKLGFRRVIIPHGNEPKQVPDDLVVTPVRHVGEALAAAEEFTSLRAAAR